MSPIFYCIYVDDLVEIPTAMGVGCHLREIFLSILLYADDMALIAPSLKGLQKLLSATEEYCKVWYLSVWPIFQFIHVKHNSITNVTHHLLPKKFFPQLWITGEISFTLGQRRVEQI